MSTDDASLEAYIRAIRTKEEVEDRLLQIPGVNGVGIGSKIANGQPTGELAIIVHLSEKKPLHKVAPDEVVPPEIEGIKTDVEESGPFQPLAEDSISDCPPPGFEDGTEYRPLRGGIRVRSSSGPEVGTMGCVVVSNAADQRAFLLTCHHVVVSGNATIPVGDEVGQPFSCIPLFACWSRPVARLTDAELRVLPEAEKDRPDGRVPGIDAAIAELDPGMTWLAAVQGRDDNPENCSPIRGDSEDVKLGEPVQKRGSRTRLTKGTIHLTNFTSTRVVRRPGTGPGEPPITSTVYLKNQIVIQPDGVECFAQTHDSGSVVLNNDGKVVGLLTGVQGRKRLKRYGYGIATPIKAIKDRFNIRVADNTEFPGVQTVPARASLTPAPASGGVPPMIMHQQRLLVQAQEAILQTSAGQPYADLVRKHQHEVRTLINSNKRVAAVWHRSGGPELVQKALQAIQSPDQPLPTHIDGRSVAERIGRILAIFRRYGSPGLRTDIDRYESAILQLSGQSFNQFLTGLRTYRFGLES